MQPAGGTPHHCCQQDAGLRHVACQHEAVKQHQTRAGVSRPRLDQRVPGLRIVPIDLRLRRGRIVVAAGEHRMQIGLQPVVGDP